MSIKNRFNIKDAKKCLAKTKRTGRPCQAPAMQNGRCRLHGGKSTGAKTDQGKAKLQEINLKHGYYTKESIQERKSIKASMIYLERYCEEFMGL